MMKWILLKGISILYLYVAHSKKFCHQGLISSLGGMMSQKNPKINEKWGHVLATKSNVLTVNKKY